MTKLSEPTYVECGVVHYAVPNMPSLVARTATLALTNATLPFVRATGARAGSTRRSPPMPGSRPGSWCATATIVHAGLAARRVARPSTA